MSRPAPARAFTLVEVTLALGIAVFCMVVVFGLLNVGLNSGTASVEQTTATNILSTVAADLRAAPTPTLNQYGAPQQPAVNSPIYNLSLPLNGSGTTATQKTLPLDATGRSTADPTAARFQLDVWMTPGTGRGPTLARLMVSWPPTASTVKIGSVETQVALDRN